MLKFVNWEELTEYQKEAATEQFVELEAHQSECSISEAAKILIGYEVPESEICNNKELQELTSSRRIEIDTENEHYVYVDL